MPRYKVYRMETKTRTGWMYVYVEEGEHSTDAEDKARAEENKRFKWFPSKKLVRHVGILE